MNSPIADYRTLIRLEPPQLQAALWRLSPPLPPGRRAPWVLALLDIAITDSYPVNQEPDVEITMRVWFASRLLDFIDHQLEIPHWERIADTYVSFARKAVEDGVQQIPPNLTADYIVGRALQRFSLTRTQALQVAAEERERYLEALTAGLRGEEFRRAVRVDGVTALFVIRNLLSEVRWFQGKVVDRDLAEELDSWLDIHSDLGLGDTIAGLLAARIQRNHENL
ncbi:hypothetical protein OHT57_00575 [Streptomyces sp. NBC_00285]|uniref:hypothetical protein n=1 Tax=Streptomyces sp. NBC_00285 TaxID=2975700 RepID=UPI002E27FE7F|nr:hypothetical protein [Streptomyces sp. NBC_00285]